MKSFVLLFLLFIVPAFSFAQVATGVVTDISAIPLDQDNPVVAISRADKNVVVIGAVADETDSLAMLAYYSSTMGASWQTSRLPRSLNADFYPSGWPSVASDTHGNFYYAFTADGTDYQGDLWDSSGEIGITLSTDGGATWKNKASINLNKVTPGHPEDVSLTVDNSPLSNHQGRLYLVWDQFYSNPDSELLNGGLYIAWSDDKGSTWLGTQFLGASDDYQQVKTGKNGEVYVSASDSLGFEHEMFISTDFGKTFTNPANLISTFTSYPTFATDTTTTVLKGVTGFAAFPYVAFDVDLTTNRLHLVYGDYQADVATLWYVYSDDKAKTWSAPEGIQLLSSSDRFDPWVAVDQATHEVYIMFYSSDSDPTNVLVAPYRIRVRDTVQQMMNPAFNPFGVETATNGVPYIGDHTNCDAFNSLFVGAWTQNRSGHGDGDVYAFVSTEKTNGVAQPVVIHSSNDWLSSPYPNPSNGKAISLQYYIPHASQISFDLFDGAGRGVKHLADRSSDEGSYSVQFDMGTITAGTYFIRMKTNEGEVTQKLIIY
jgi:hypothetical protein